MSNLDKDLRKAIVMDNVRVLRELFASVLPSMFTLDTTLSQAQIRLAASLRLYDGKPYTVAELAKVLGRPRSTVQKTLDEAVDRGMFYYENDLNDGRRKRIMVSPEGWAIIRGYEDAFIEFRLASSGRLQAILNETTSRALSQDILAVLENHGHTTSTTAESK